MREQASTTPGGGPPSRPDRWGNHVGPDPAGPVAPERLTDVDRAMLLLERRPWRHPVAKEQAIRLRFGWTPTGYYQRLNRLIDRPAAWAADPVTVKRLRRRRDERSGVGGW